MSEKAKLVGGHATLEIPKGSMFLYQQPELLTKEEHGSLGLVTPQNPFEFAKKIMTVPLVAAEISSAQKHYPVVFSEPDNAAPFAVVSVIKDENMFVDASGNWEPMHYIPSYLRRHPFAFAAADDDQLAVVIDRSSNAISDNPDQPFFESGGLSKRTQDMVDYCGQYEAERRRTKEFAAKLKELDLLVLQEVIPTAEESKEKLATYYAVDVEKLNELESGVLMELHKKGYLSFIFAHLFSLENWKRLLERRHIMQESQPAE